MLSQGVGGNMKRFFLMLWVLGGLALPGAQASDLSQGVLRDALGQAAQKRCLLLVLLHAKWCGPCHAMEKAMVEDQALAHKLHEHFVLVKVDGDSPEGKAIQTTYALPQGYPMTLGLSSRGEEIDRLMGWTAEAFATFLDDLVAGRNTLPQLRDRCSREPEQGDGLVALAKKYASRGDTEEAIRAMTRALQDPEVAALAENHFSCTMYCLNACHFPEAKHHLAQALRRDPRNELYLKFQGIIAECLLRDTKKGKK